MKSGIHPVYKIVQVTCACGETFTTRSTRDDIRLEICAKCHPFFTGKQKLIDSAGRVERFEKRYKNVPKDGTAGKKASTAAGKTAAPAGSAKAAAPAAAKAASKAKSAAAEGKGPAAGA